jgi:hypothetical protein
MGHAICFVEKAGLRQMEFAFVSDNLGRFTQVPLELLRWGSSVSKRYNEAA